MGDSKPKRSLSKLGKLFGAGVKESDDTKEDEIERKSREEQLRILKNGINGMHVGVGVGTGTGTGAGAGAGAGAGGSKTTSGSSTPRTPSEVSSPQLSPAPVADKSATTNLKSASASPIISPTIRSQPVSRSASLRKASGNNIHTLGTNSNSVSANGNIGNIGTTSDGNLTTVGAINNGATGISRAPSTKPTNGSYTNLGLLAPGNPAMINKPRFKVLENGNHEHNLRSAKRQEKLSNMLKDLLGAKKLRDGAKSEVPNILQSTNNSISTTSQNQSHQISPTTSNTAESKPPTLFAGLVSQVKNNTSPYHGNIPKDQQDCRSFVEKYGRCQEVIGKGSFGVVRVSHKKSDITGIGEILYAVKEFKRKPSELDQKYNRRLTSEFCISSSLKHINIIDTLDLLKDAKGDYCEVMEFCSGGDLYTLIIALGKLEYAEADCFFKQLIRGVNYMHEMGVSHRDLKPENVLLTQRGVLKITDFGNGECFKMAWENEVQLSEGICGSSPYIAPEEFTQKQFDPRCVDIWACGVIYMAMRTGRQLWKLADPKEDEFFKEYLLKRKDATGYEPIESLKRARCRNVIYSILDPKPERRINGKQILNSEWGREIKVCAAGEGHEEPEY